MTEQKAPFFTKEDFELLAKWQGEIVEYSSGQNPKDLPEFKDLKRIYEKLENITDNAIKHGFSLDIRKNPISPSKVTTFKEYFMAKLYPKAYPDAESKVGYMVRLNKDGIKLSVDKRHIDEEIKKITSNIDSNSFDNDKYQLIHEGSTEIIEKEEVITLSEVQLAERITAYCADPSHKSEFVELGSIVGIESCVKEYDKIQMEEYKKLLLNSKNLILTGAPGTGKTYLAKKIAEAIVGEDKPDHIGFVQFHPSYDYTDFVEGLRPVSKNETIGFERKDGIFMEFCRKALNEPNNNYVFIIDEINRGDMSKILGELFFSIDPGYRGKKGRVSTQYKNLWDKDFGGSYEFYIPKNVFIIGTMNDIDRSVESMDFAMRRRFTFNEVKPEDRMSMIYESDNLTDKEEIKNRMNNLNEAIKNEESLGSAYQIGPAYFLKLENYAPATKWDDLWNFHLYGLLFEYLRGEPPKRREELLNGFKKTYDNNPDKKNWKKNTDKNVSNSDQTDDKTSQSADDDSLDNNTDNESKQ